MIMSGKIRAILGLGFAALSGIARFQLSEM
jgi:hypothetical protein